MTVARAALAALLVLGCSSKGEQQADTFSVTDVDTLKPAGGTTGATAAAVDTISAAPRPATSSGAQSKTVTTTPPPRDTTNIGRDRAIPINTKDTPRRLPTVDTTKRPPRQER